MTDWDTTDQTFHTFFDRLAAGAFPHDPPDDFVAFRNQCEAREKQGRGIFGTRYLSRRNLAEAREEAADLAMYSYLDSLRAIKDGKGDEDYELVLTVAHFAYKAYAASLWLEAKRNGAP